MKELLTLLKDIKALLQAQKQEPLLSKELWTADDIAEYLGMSKSTVQGSIINNANFPNRIRVPTTNKHSCKTVPRWLSNEVRLYVKRQKEL